MTNKLEISVAARGNNGSLAVVHKRMALTMKSDDPSAEAQANFASDREKRAKQVKKVVSISHGGK